MNDQDDFQKAGLHLKMLIPGILPLSPLITGWVLNVESFRIYDFLFLATSYPLLIAIWSKQSLILAFSLITTLMVYAAFIMYSTLPQCKKRTVEAEFEEILTLLIFSFTAYWLIRVASYYLKWGKNE